jgi:hypothetical protein
VFHPDIIVSRTRVDLDPHTISTKHLDQDLERLETESTTVLDRTAPLVVAFVGGSVKELVDEVAVGRVELDTVKAGLEGQLGGFAVVVQDRSRIGDGRGNSVGLVSNLTELKHRYGRTIGDYQRIARSKASSRFRAHLSTPSSNRTRSVNRSTGPFLLLHLRVGNPTDVPALHDDRTSFVVYGLGEGV